MRCVCGVWGLVCCGWFLHLLVVCDFIAQDSGVCFNFLYCYVVFGP